MFSTQSFQQRRREPSGAVISECETYRYLLWRIWDKKKPMLAYILLNPSTADHQQDDPTMTRCIRRSQDLGFGGMWVANLFALRSTDPKNLYTHKTPIGPLNDEVLLAVCHEADTVMCGWGNHGVFQNRGQGVVQLLKDKNITPKCLGLSGKNQPLHPLYQPYTALLQDF
jgi:hypothetical protein